MIFLLQRAHYAEDEQVGHFVEDPALVDGVDGRTARLDRRDGTQIEARQFRMPTNVGDLRWKNADHFRLKNGKINF